MESEKANLEDIDWVGIAPEAAEMIIGRPPDAVYFGVMRWNKYPGAFDLFYEGAFFANFAKGVGGDVMEMVSHLCGIDLLDVPAWLFRNGFLPEASAQSMREELRTRKSEEDARIREERRRGLTALEKSRDVQRHFSSNRDFEKLRAAGRDLAEVEDFEEIADILPWNNPDRLQDPIFSDGNVVYYRRRYASDGEAISFEDAKRLAVALFTYRIPDLKDSTTWRTPDNARLVLAEYLSDSKLPALIEASENSPLMWWALQYCLRDLRTRDNLVPPPLLEWALEVANGKRTEPGGRRGRPTEFKEIRNRWVVRVLKDLKSCGLPPRRDGRVYPEKEDSGCDVVAEALKNFGKAPGRYGIEKIWQREVRNSKKTISG